MPKAKDLYRNLGPVWTKKSAAGNYYSVRLTFEGVEWLYHVMKQFKKTGAPRNWVPVLIVPDFDAKKRYGWPSHKAVNPYKPK